jgi:hypothetical protein
MEQPDEAQNPLAVLNDDDVMRALGQRDLLILALQKRLARAERADPPAPPSPPPETGDPSDG